MTQTRPRRRPLTHQEKLALQERKQRRREKMEESRELAKGPIDLTFCLLVMLLTAIGLVILLSASFPSAYYEEKRRPATTRCITLSGRRVFRRTGDGGDAAGQ